jgi:hypothetical protein
MLATLPIVKFGDQDETSPKPPVAGQDIEMNAPGAPKPGQTDAAAAATEEPAPTGGATEPLQHTNGDKISETLAESAPGAAAASNGPSRNADGTQEDGSLGCSICTEDFTRGEEVRVLPCNHKFHPECVDPWLLNVSGTCPLCRIDLRPPTADGDVVEDATAPAEDGSSALPPPLGMDTPGRPASVDATNDFGPPRRESMPSLIHMRNATNAQERIAALRHLRDTSRTLPQTETSTASRQSVTSRLRDRFRIRTTRAREPSVDDTEEQMGGSEATRHDPLFALSGLPTPPQPRGQHHAAELRPLREVYRFRRRRS